MKRMKLSNLIHRLTVANTKKLIVKFIQKGRNYGTVTLFKIFETSSYLLNGKASHFKFGM